MRRAQWWRRSTGRQWLWCLALLPLAAYGSGRAAGQGGYVLSPPTRPARAKPTLEPQTGHSGPVTSVAFSPDGSRLATGSADRRAIVWALDNGRQEAIYTRGREAVVSVGFTPDGQTVAIVSRDGLCKAWNLRDGQAMAAGFGHPAAGVAHTIGCVRPGPDGRELVLAFDDLVIGTAETGRRLLLRPRLKGGLPGRKYLVCLSADGGKLASAEAGGAVVRLWDVESGQTAGTLQGASAPIASLCFSGNGEHLASASGDGSVVVWNPARGTAGMRLPPEGGGVPVVSLIPDGRYLALGTPDGTVRVCDVPSGRAMWALRGHSDGITSLCFSADGTKLASGSRDRTAVVWDVASGRPQTTLKGRVAPVACVAVSPDGKRLASTAGTAAAIWDLETGRVTRALSARTRPLTALCFSRAANALATASEGAGEPVWVWDPDGSQAPRALTGHTGAVTSLAFSPDGRLLAAGSRSKAVFVWDIGPGKLMRVLGGHRGEVVSVDFSPDGRRVAAAAGEAVLWNVESGQRERALPVGTATSVSFSPDGARLAVGSASQAIGVWDVVSGRGGRIVESNAYGAFTSVAFHPGGRLVAAATGERFVLLFDAQTGQPQKRMAGHRAPALSVAFSPDGNLLVSGSADGSTRAWDLRRCPDLALTPESAILFAVDGGREWLATLGIGYYDCSLEGSQCVAWRVGEALYPFDHFAEKFHRPDLLRRSLAGGDVFDEPPLGSDQVPPNIAFVSPKYGAEVAEAAAAVEIEAAGLAPIRRLDLTVNGQPLPLQAARGLEVAEPTESRRRFRIAVPLPPGEPRVRLRAAAYDTEGLRSRPAELVLFRPGVKQSVGALHVLCVGINRYRSPDVPALRYAVPDAVAVAETLARQGSGKPYTRVQAQVLTDEAADLARLKFALRELKDAAAENDVAVIFLSGHGVRDEGGRFYFGSCDLDVGRLPATALGWEDFAAALREVRAKRVLVLADTCHSGGILGAGRAAGDLLAYRINQESNRLVFVSSRGDEVSLGRGEWGHGAFTRALLDALAGAADSGPKDGRITFRELRDFVPGRVEALTEGRQHPQLPFLDNYDPDALLAMVPSGGPPPAAITR